MHEPHDVHCGATAGTVKKDANVNALVNFDCFAQVVQFAMDDLLRGSIRILQRTDKTTVVLLLSIAGSTRYV